MAKRGYKKGNRDRFVDLRSPMTPEELIEYRGKDPIILAEKSEEGKRHFINWAIIPASLRLLAEQPEELRKMGYDPDDEYFMKLLKIKTKGQFCREFNFAKNMTATWLKDEEVVAEINSRVMSEHVMKFKKDVDWSFTQKVIRHGDANRVKLWKQLYEGWNEKTENVNLNVNLTPADLVAEIERRNQKIRGGDAGV